MKLKLEYQVGRCFQGKPVYLHISMLLALGFFVADAGPLQGAVMTLAFVFLMLAHEMGHAWFVRKYDHHLLDIRLFPLHGECNYEYDARYELETLIFAGGLLVQLVILIPCVLLQESLQLLELNSAQKLLAPVFHVLININVMILFINALPIPGLDGHSLWLRLWDNVKARIKIQRSHSKRETKSVPPPEEQVDARKVVDMAIHKAKKKE